jgi:beta-glucosidase
MTKEPSFPKDFIWGASTAAYQVEGAIQADGRGPSIWDTFSHTPGKVTNNHHADTTCDQFHLYKTDVELMKNLGINAYRFSIAWPRIFPDGKTLNSKGFDYYKSLIDCLLKAGITPFITLYHWDLPQALQNAGGWINRDTAYRFAEYAQTCFQQLNSTVSTWMTLNEPQCITYFGHEEGIHAPGLRRPEDTFRVAHHLNLAHGLAVQALRSASSKPEIGIVLQNPLVQAATNSEQDRLAFEKKMDKQARVFLDPLFGKGYSQQLQKNYPDRPIPVQDGDLEIIASPCDFLGLNVYFRETVAHDSTAPDGYRSVVTNKPKTALQWDIDPSAITANLQWIKENYGSIPIYIAENGCANPNDTVDNKGECHDPDRIAFLSAYLEQCREALAAGIQLKGYFLWSFIDNFEWNMGYAPRFGIVHCDYNTLKRTPKDSYYYFQQYISSAKHPSS